MVTIIQSKSTVSVGSQFTQSSTLSLSATVGNLIVFTGMFPTLSPRPVVTITDSLANVYSPFGVILDTGQGFMMWGNYAQCGQTGALTYTVNYSTPLDSPSVGVIEFHSDTGWGNGIFQDGYNMSSNSFGTTISSSDITTTNPTDLLIATCLHGVNVTTELTAPMTQPPVGDTLGQTALVVNSALFFVGNTVSIGTTNDTYTVTIVVPTALEVTNLGTGSTPPGGVIPSSSPVTLIPSPPTLGTGWSFIMHQTPTLSVAWKYVNVATKYSFTAGQTNSSQWAAVIWSFQVPVSSSGGGGPPVLTSPTSSLIASSFPEVYPNRIPEDVYDSLSGQPDFVFKRFGPSYNP